MWAWACVCMCMHGCTSARVARGCVGCMHAHSACTPVFAPPPSSSPPPPQPPGPPPSRQRSRRWTRSSRHSASGTQSDVTADFPREGGGCGRGGRGAIACCCDVARGNHTAVSTPYAPPSSHSHSPSLPPTPLPTQPHFTTQPHMPHMPQTRVNGSTASRRVYTQASMGAANWTPPFHRRPHCPQARWPPTPSLRV